MGLTFRTRQIEDLNITRAKLENNAVNAGKADLSGLWNFSSSQLQLGGIQVATLDDVQGRTWKDACRVASTGNLTLSAAQTIDGISITAGQRVLVKDQTDAEDNGIYVVAGGAWARADDMSVAAEVKGSSVFVMEGTLNADTSFVASNDDFITLGTDNITFAIQAHLAELTAGDGLAKSGHVVSVDLAADSGLEIQGSKLQIDLDDNTLERDSNGLHIKGLGVTAAHLASNSVEAAKINGGAVTTSKLANDAVDRTKINSDVAGNGLSQAAGGELQVDTAEGVQFLNGAIRVKLNAATLNQTASGLKISDGGVDASQIANDAVNRTKINSDVAGTGLTQNNNGSLEITAAGVATGMIANDAVDKTKINSDVAGVGIGQNGDGSLEVGGGSGINATANGVEIDLHATPGLEFDGAKIRAKVTGALEVVAGGIRISANSVDSGMIATNAVGADELANNAVDTSAIADNAVTLAKAGWTPKVEGFSGNGSLKVFALAEAVPDSHKAGCMVFINGQYMELTGSSPGSNQFSIDDNAGTARVTLGDTMAAGERMIVSYIY